MAKISEIINKIENFAPPSLAADWDNSGWQIFLEDCEVDRVLLAISPTLNVIEQAIENNCRLIISHHPMIFSKINKICSHNITIQPVIKAIQNNIQVYSAHTNLDSTNSGIADTLANLLEFKNIQPFEDYARIGELEQDVNIDEYLLLIKDKLNIQHIKVVNQLSKTKIRKIAVCPGSGGDFINKLEDIDLYLTSDIRYHNALEVNNMIVADAGHLETEKIILPVLKELLQDFNIEILIAEEVSPFKIF